MTFEIKHMKLGMPNINIVKRNIHSTLNHVIIYYSRCTWWRLLQDSGNNMVKLNIVTIVHIVEDSGSW